MHGLLRRWPALGLLTLVSLFAACKGSYSPVDFQGLWSGTVTRSGSNATSFVCMIGKNGPMLCYNGRAEQYIVPAVTGTLSPFQSAGWLSAQPGETVVYFPLLPTLSLSAQGSGDQSGVSGQFLISVHAGGPGSDFMSTFTETFTLHPYQAMPGTAAIQSGQWTGFYPDPVGTGTISADITVAASGAFSGSNGSGCTLTGALLPVAGEPDLFTVQLVASGAATCDAASTGLAYESSTDDLKLFNGAPGPYYYMVVSHEDPLFGPEGSLLVFRAQ